ncbi:MAG: heparinase II/III family protein [Sneathiella sp.]|nr:heparinase II/III family protein [Sneathiella sp.]
MSIAAVGSPLKSVTLPPRKSFLDFIFSTSSYATSLRTRTPKKLIANPVEAMPGDALRADAIFQGHFLLSGIEAKLTNIDPWFAADMPLHWHYELHNFDWLRDFSANGSDASVRHARALVLSWIKHFDTYRPHIWDAGILARRLINWTRQSQFLMTPHEGDFNYKFLRSLREQYNHLGRYNRFISRDDDKFETTLALYLCALCFPDTDGQARKYKKQLLEQIDSTILADGCHTSRSPARHMSLLSDLIGLKHTLNNLQEEIPSALMGGIDRLAPVVRFFQHGDGSLALFNGSVMASEGTVDHLLAIAEAPGRPPHRCPKGGFERLKAGRALLLLETGEGGRPKTTVSHQGIGSLEFSYGRDRIFVNCGAHPDATSPWGKALSATAAHSTLCLSDQNATFPQPSQNKEPDPVKVTTHAEGGNLWLELTNPGYMASHGVAHTRRLYLEASGQNLRGEEVVTATKDTAETTEFQIRFHLHPDLSISKSIGGRNLFIKTKNGDGWQFASSLGDLSLEEGIYCAQAGKPRKSQQIVLRGRLHGNAPLSIKWSLKMLGESDAEL